MVTNIIIYGTEGDPKLSGLTPEQASKVYSGESADKTANGQAIISTTEGDAVTKDKGVSSESGGSSNIPSAARIPPGQIAGSAIANSNKNVAHVCNVPASIQLQLYKAGAFGGKIVSAIRKAIKAVLKFFGIEPSSNSLVQYLKKVAAWIKKFTDWLKDINKYIQGLLSYISIVREVISWILSLPAYLMNFFKDCLKQAYAALKAGYLSAIAIEENTPLDADTSEFLKEFEQAKAEFDTMKNEFDNTVNNVSQVTTQTSQSLQDVTSKVASGEITPENWQQSVQQINQQYYSSEGFSKDTNTGERP